MFPSDPAAATLPAAVTAPQLCVLGLLFVPVVMATRGRTAAAAAAAAAVGSVLREQKTKQNKESGSGNACWMCEDSRGSVPSPNIFAPAVMELPIMRRTAFFFFSFNCAAAFQFSDFCLQLMVFGFLDLRLVILFFARLFQECFRNRKKRKLLSFLVQKANFSDTHQMMHVE